ncbi:VanW family protein [Cohnella endophytica]|nr:VanW family protein [Cohnella endophytica]
MKQYLLKKIPALYNLRIMQLRLQRHILNLNPAIHYSMTRSSERLKFPIMRHQSLLRRKLGTSDPKLQENKITNLRISSSKIDGIMIKPGETFSFWKLVGKTTSKKGYIEGLQLSQGEVKTGIGGGVCQLANLLFWLFLHSPLELRERYHHSFDPFPDDRRVLPFGSGASVFYNYVDLRFYNNTESTFQITVWLTHDHIKGSIHCNHNWPNSYHVEERGHRFIRANGKNFRENEIWRKVVDKITGNTVLHEMMIKNFSEVKYEVTQDGNSFV